MSKNDGDLISRSAILRKLRIKADGKSVIDGLFTAFAGEVCEKIIEPETAVDAVEVVRCMDCKTKGWIQEPCHGKSVDFCRLLGFCITDAEKCFCSAGERRDWNERQNTCG